METEEFETFKIHTPRLTNDVLEREKSQIIPKHFIFPIVGKPGSGKTTLFANMLNEKKALKGKFEAIILYSPSPIENIPESCPIVREFNLEKLENHLEKLNERAEEKKLEKAHVLIFVDDFVVTISKYKNHQRFLEHIFNRRHLYPNLILSWVITAQSYIRLPKDIRRTSDCAVMFQLGENDMKELSKELLANGESSLKASIDRHWRKDPHNFIFINCQSGKVFGNFEKCLL